MTTTHKRREARAGNPLTRALAYFNANIAFRTLCDTICAVSGFVFVDYALSLGIPKEQIGYFPALVYLASLFQLVGLWAVPHFRNRKHFILAFGYLEPVVFIMAILGALAAPMPLRFPLLVGLLFLASAALHMTRPVTDAWLATAIPSRVRGRVLGRRFQVVSALTIAGMLLMGVMARLAAGSGRHSSAGFALVLVFGGMLGLAAMFMFARITLPIAAEERRMNWADARTILRHRPFRRFLGAVVLYNLPFWLATPYHQVYHLKVLQLRETTIAGIMMGSYALNFLLSPFFGRWIDRLGSRRIIFAFTPVYVGFFAAYLFSSPARPWLVFVAWLCFGIGNSAYASANTAALYQSLSDVERRQPFFALYNLGIFFSTAVMATVSAALVSLLKDASLVIGPIMLGQFQLLYLTCLGVFSISFLGTALLPAKK